MNIERFEIGRIKNLKELGNDDLDIPTGQHWFVFELDPASEGTYDDIRFLARVGYEAAIMDEFKEGDNVLLLFDREYGYEGETYDTLVRLLNLTTCEKMKEISPVLAARRLVELREAAQKATAALEEQLKWVSEGAMQKRDPHAIIGICPLCNLPINEDDNWTEGDAVTHKECPIDPDAPPEPPDDEG